MTTFQCPPHEGRPEIHPADYYMIAPDAPVFPGQAFSFCVKYAETALAAMVPEGGEFVNLRVRRVIKGE